MATRFPTWFVVPGFVGMALAALFASCYVLVDLVPADAFKPTSDGGVWVAPEDAGVATRYVDGKWAEEYRFDDNHRRVEWSYDDSSGHRHVRKYDPETGPELSHDLILTPPPSRRLRQ